MAQPMKIGRWYKFDPPLDLEGWVYDEVYCVCPVVIEPPYAYMMRGTPVGEEEVVEFDLILEGDYDGDIIDCSPTLQ